MINLYFETDCSKIEKRIFSLKVLSISIIILFVVIEVLLLLFATYDKKALFMIFASLLAVFSVISLIYCIDKSKYLMIIVSEYKYLVAASNTIKEVKIIASPKRFITLADSSCVYVITVEENKKKSVLYLSNIFDNVFEEEKNYLIKEAHHYIIGYESKD